MSETRTESRTVPAPEPPDSPDAWYAPDVRAQYEVRPGVVATVEEYHPPLLLYGMIAIYG